MTGRWIAALVLAGTQAFAACVDDHVRIAAGSEAYAARICATADRHLSKIAECGLGLTDRVTVEVVTRMPPDAAHCWGIYRCEGARVLILDPDTLNSKAAARDIFGGLSGDGLFASILMHELTHAAIAQTIGNRHVTLSGHEYIAYALQVASLPEPQRTAYLSAQDLPETPTTDYFNPFILGVQPDKFAALAYAHFTAPENGCGFVGRLLSGEVVLGEPPAE